ncbi:ComEC/Rec2 family competence protein [Azospirillum argentinense]|uniref:ComEC/Rec2 family competence protein n=1 Tax=Azospirillum argentinense TaxID=2970906 RepID=A0ABW8VLH0_9PROT
MFQLEMLPACEGDCLILSWGDPAKPFRLLIDAGRDSTADAVQTYVERHGWPKGMFELFIITHIDRDHIEGAVKLLRDERFRPLVKGVWFNDRNDLDYAPPASKFEEYGALDGERLTQLIAKHGMASNVPFKPAPVAVERDQLRIVTLDGGLSLTVLSPDQQQLANLAKPWDDTLRDAPAGWEDYGEAEPIDIDFLASRPFKGDKAKPNGSSIAMVATFEGRSALLTGDAHVGRLLTSLELYKTLHPEHDRFALVKAAHHGSRGNVSLDLVRAVKCDRWAISTSGSQFKHPDREAIARIISGSPGPVGLFFNYDTTFTRYWRNPPKQAYAFTPEYGDEGYLTVDIPALP